MKIIAQFWHKICEPLDGFLWRRDITHGMIRPLLRNQILAAGGCVLLGGACYFVFSGIFWFGMGLAAITWVFWSWAKFFLRVNIGEYSSAFLRAILLRFMGRLALIAFLLYVALAVCKASVGAILAGMVCGAVVAIASSAYRVIVAGRGAP